MCIRDRQIRSSYRESYLNSNRSLDTEQDQPIFVQDLLILIQEFTSNSGQIQKAVLSHVKELLENLKMISSNFTIYENTINSFINNDIKDLQNNLKEIQSTHSLIIFLFYL
eukprot:TRINITY_DN49006_c0_g1_i1.p2 TRINITY_DN49006_c0_g1~~TRINITY_DN49006_c0_g1_i1.p2  ORF type:complete len:111 (+),score=11.10 TRINITY_DN49006_c0_g1_i1:168-500(+)